LTQSPFQQEAKTKKRQDDTKLTLDYSVKFNPASLDEPKLDESRKRQASEERQTRTKPPIAEKPELLQKNAKPESKKYQSPQEKQLSHHSSGKGLGRPIVPQIEETEALRDEEKRRLQALLSERALNLNAETSTPTDEKKLEQELNQEFEEVFEQNLRFEVKPTLPEPESESNQTHTPAIESECDGTFHDELAHKTDWHKNGRPHWGQESFDVLLFEVSGLTLAVPLVALGQIVRFQKEELTPIFGQSDWFMGLLESNVGRLRVINTALFVMPEKYDQAFLDSAEYAISLDGVQWALAVDKVNQPIRLDPTEINWRSERSKRPWLAGTVKSQMCALLDIPQMANLLNESDPSLSAP
jgi:purine-binding chemotaxis protein CheW